MFRFPPPMIALSLTLRGFLIAATFFSVSPFLNAQQVASKLDRQQPSKQLTDQGLVNLTENLQKQIDEKKLAGIVAGVCVDGKTEYLQAVGQLGSSSNRAMQTDSLFRIASMTKPITSAAIMVLIEEGKLSLHDPLSKYLPGFQSQRVLKTIQGESIETIAAEREPTIKDLLTHQSGLTYGWFGPEKLDAIYREQRIPNLFEPIDETIGARVQRIQKVPLKFQPGTAWDYGVSTDVLGRVIEVASGVSLDEFFRRRFFQPLKMNDTFFHVPSSKQDRLAGLFTLDSNSKLLELGHEPTQSGFFRFSADYCTQPVRFFSGGGGLVSTTEDYIRFLQMLLNGGELDGVRVLAEESVRMMTTNQIGQRSIPFSGHGDGFGFGFGVETGRQPRETEFSVGSYSWGGIFNTYFWVDPQRNLVAVMMSQVFPNNHLSTRDQFRSLVYAALETGETDMNDDSDELQKRSFAQYAFKNQGNKNAGKKTFALEKLQCTTCHKIHGQGGSVGPDLSNIGGKFDRPHLVDALLHPSKQINYGYELTTIATKSGRVYSGIIKEKAEDKVTLMDAKSKRQVIATAEIDQIKSSKVSIMPESLHKAITEEQFTDLIAYLESLGGSRNGKGAAIGGPISLLEGFQITTVATGLSGATALEVAPDGRVFVCEQSGRLRLIENGVLLEEPFLEIPVEMNWERGLIGVTVAPDFPKTPYVYVVYVSKGPYSHHRISRFQADGNLAIPGSEDILFKGDDQSKFGGNKPAGHQGGAIHFGVDGKLYVAIGDQTAGTPAQQMNAIQGKILRLNLDGSIPTDNPFLNETTGKYRAIWALGCRNPFTFAISERGEMLINDVGGRFEEINRGAAGVNYGWPKVEHGPTKRTEFTGPIHTYPQSSINGGDFCSVNSNWPDQFQGKYFFADFVKGWVKFVDPENAKKSSDFLGGIRRPVDLRFAPDGSLYVLLRNAWVVDGKFEPGTGSIIRIDYVGEGK